MTKVLVATVKPFAPKAIEEISKTIDQAGYELSVLEKYSGKKELIQALSGVQALIVRSDQVDREVLAAADDLKIVVRAGAGYDNVDLEAAREQDAVVMNTPGQNANAVAELAFGMMIYGARNHFSGTPGTELKGKSIGLHAYGNVGRHMNRIARGFDMDVAAFDPFIDRDVIEKAGIRYVDRVEDLYGSCQYVSLHIPANDRTRESINYQLLSLMPPGAVLVNTARKEIMHEPSLLKIMEEREDFRYLSDIAPEQAGEFTSDYSGRVYFTPKKMGAQTAEANINAGLAAARQIVAFFEQGDTSNQVN